MDDLLNCKDYCDPIEHEVRIPILLKM